ncbi:FMN-binding glutamate synthase family protein [Ammoniphilus resinae]|uniref:Glutamate synthase domain-containing protein 2 n=1 Tax=Ammoniphilus resinae TaxID=861532 RepID=A0ABS4GPA7_9BACL|nr:FMN-binding glutamate synthase family protein [Ammoniphilus resinae]MBP1932100.1 glutamate synthase domain-containing protein 2 [Ammoniphilus resinae]
MKWYSFLLGSFTGALLAILLAGILLLVFMRPLIKWITGSFMKRLMSDRYPENIWEMVSAMTRTNPRIVIENSLRAESGKIIERPFGSPRKFLNFDGLIFSAAQLSTMPAPEDAPVETRIIIGPRAKKPLILDIPLLVGALGYGIGITKQVRLAIAKATTAVGTATNTGEGGFLPEDRAAAKHFILQYNSAHWSKSPEILHQADAIEIHFGQGASAGSASFIPPEYMQGEARDVLQVPEGETVVIPSLHPDVQKPKDLKILVQRLRTITKGVPIGIKICASANLEADLEIAIQSQVDFISIDGGQAGTKGAAPILEDDFGLPTIFALTRAVQYLKKRQVKEHISLLIGGGFNQPGECLKALALGADAVYMGTSIIWAMTHKQVTKAVPFEPPTQLVYYPGSMTDQFDEDEAATNLTNFFTSFIEEIKVAVRAMGKTSVHHVGVKDLVALDEWTSKVTKVRLVTEPFNPPTSSGMNFVNTEKPKEKLKELPREQSKEEQKPKESTNFFAFLRRIKRS